MPKIADWLRLARGESHHQAELGPRASNAFMHLLSLARVRVGSARSRQPRLLANPLRAGHPHKDALAPGAAADSIFKGISQFLAIEK